MQAREALACCKVSLMGSTGQRSEDQSANRDVAIRKNTKETSVGNKASPLTAELEAMCVILWQKIYLHSAHVLALFSRLRLRGGG